jgi:hypothetical protein
MKNDFRAGIRARDFPNAKKFASGRIPDPESSIAAMKTDRQNISINKSVKQSFTPYTPAALYLVFIYVRG